MSSLLIGPVDLADKQFDAGIQICEFTKHDILQFFDFSNK